MVVHCGKVPGWTWGLAVVVLAACGGEARSEQSAHARERAALAASSVAVPSEPVPSPREAAAVSARAGSGAPDPATGHQAERLAEPRDASLKERPTVSASERAPLPVQANLEPEVSTREDAAPTVPEDGPAPEPGAQLDDVLPTPEPKLAGLPVASPAAPVVGPPDPEPSGVLLAKGVEIPLAMEDDLSTRESRPGDAFFAHVVDDVIDGSGMVLVPLGARVRGRVVDSRKSSGPDDPAVLELAVEALIVEGRQYPMVATVVRTETEATSGESTSRTVAKIGVGAAAGAILGKLLGKDTEAAVAGAVAGAAAGTAAAVSSKDGHAAVRAGSELIVRLDVPIELDAH